MMRGCCRKVALSSEAKRAYKKAQKTRKKRRRNNHWFFIRKGDSKKEVFSKIFTQIAAVVFIVCCVVLFDYFKASFDNMRLNTTLQDLYGNVTDVLGGNGQLLPNAEKLLEVNPDTVGWVKVDGTKIDLPVVLRKDDDQEKYYYLTHNFQGQKAKAGALFIDHRTTIGANKQSDNLVIYGHNEADGTMFGELDKYKKDIDFYRQHPVVNFNTNYEAGQYKIIAMFVTNVLKSQDRNGVVFDYHNYIDMDKARYDDFIGNVMLRTQVNTTVDTKVGDEFLTLSTCSNEFEPSRFVVIARKVRKGEDPAVDTAGATVNKNAKEPDWDTIYGR
ncbi:MAG TPA: class B sortase [Oscillospiraceae bacterium]|nr:class B sortase [Oscillospiraceae bacterium]